MSRDANPRHATPLLSLVRADPRVISLMLPVLALVLPFATVIAWA